MTINKFGRYFTKTSKKSSHLLRFTKKEVDFEHRVLRNVSRGIRKSDAITKAQLEESVNLCIGKIKALSKIVEELSKKLAKTPSEDISKVPIIKKKKKNI